MAKAAPQFPTPPRSMCVAGHVHSGDGLRDKCPSFLDSHSCDSYLPDIPGLRYLQTATISGLRTSLFTLLLRGSRRNYKSEWLCLKSLRIHSKLRSTDSQCPLACTIFIISWARSQPVLRTSEEASQSNSFTSKCSCRA